MTQKKINIPPAVAFILVFAPLFGIMDLQLVGLGFAIQWGVALCGLNCADMAEYSDRLLGFASGYTCNIIALFFYAIMALVLYSVWYRMAFHKGEKFVNPFKGLTGRPVLFIAGLIVFTIGAQYLCSYIAEGLGVIFPSWMARYKDLMEGAGLSGENLGMVTLIYAVVLGPIVEELSFRGLTYHYARICMPYWAANILQAILFGALHGNMLQACFAFVLGWLLGYVYEKYNNLLVTMIIHMMYNGFAFLIEFLAGKLVDIDAAADAIEGANFANPTYAATFAIFFFMSMVMTYLGSQMLTKATVKKEVKISE